jgi:hypothetical protein
MDQLEEIKRHFSIVAEALRSDIRQIAEGHSVIRHELQEMRHELRDEFKEMRALMRLSFSQWINVSKVLKPTYSVEGQGRSPRSHQEMKNPCEISTATCRSCSI